MSSGSSVVVHLILLAGSFELDYLVPIYLGRILQVIGRRIGWAKKRDGGSTKVIKYRSEGGPFSLKSRQTTCNSDPDPATAEYLNQWEDNRFRIGCQWDIQPIPF